MAEISKGITLSYKASAEGSSYTALTNLQEIPELGGSAEPIEITTLADSAHVYRDGLLDYGDSLEFKFLYDKAQFTTLNELSGTIYWQVKLPDDTTCSFTGSCSVKFEGVGIASALTYVLAIQPSSAMTWA